MAKEPLSTHHEFNTFYPSKDGYLLTTRGNPFGNVVRQDDKVIVHSASGLDFQVSALNSIRIEKKWHNPKDAVSAMIMAKSHLEKLECYACHSTWAPGLTFHSIYETKKTQVP